MRADPPASGERIIAGYAAAVAVAVFFAGVGVAVHLHPAALSGLMPSGVTEAVIVFLTTFLLVLAVALVPIVAGLAAFRWARVSHPAWFAVYGAAIGLLLGNLFTDVAMGLLLPAIAGAAGGLTFRGIVGSPAVASIEADTPLEGQSPPVTRASLIDHDAQAAYVSDALASGDPALVVLALKEIGMLRRIPVALDENPPLGEVLRAARELGLSIAVSPASPSPAPVLSLHHTVPIERGRG